jgi:hypothetical protein
VFVLVWFFFSGDFGLISIRCSFLHKQLFCLATVFGKSMMGDVGAGGWAGCLLPGN